MKVAKSAKLGQLVQVPTYCFAPMRRGWNGWLFTKGIITGFGTSKKTGSRIVKVEMPNKSYAVCYRTRRGDVAIGERTTIEKWFLETEIFEADLSHQEWITQFPRDHFDLPSYDYETEFLIDKGMVVDRFPI